MSVGACLATAPLLAYVTGIAAGGICAAYICALLWRRQAMLYRELLNIRSKY